MKVLSINHKLPSLNKVVQEIDNYEKSHNGQPVFVELLNRLGLLLDDWFELEKNNPNHKVVRMLKMYNQHILVQLEKRLVYSNPKEVNGPGIVFYLKKTHPERFGDKVIEIKTTPVKDNKFGDLKNESDIDLMKLSLC